MVLKQVNALMLKNSLSKGKVVKSSDLIESPTWVGKDRSLILADASKAVGRELSHSMNAGDLIRHRDLLNPVVARRGDLIWVTATLGKTLSVRMSVIALEGGRLGDQIKVKNNSSQKVFSVRLTSNKAARVQF